MFSPQGTPYGRAQSGGAARAPSTFPPSPRYQVPQFHPILPTRPCLGTPTQPHPVTPSELDRAVEARLQGSREVDAQLFNQMTRDPRLRKGPEPPAWPQKGMAQEPDWSSYNSPSRLFASPSIAPPAMAPPTKTVPTMAPPSNTPPAMSQLTITTPTVDLSNMTRSAQTIPGLSPPIVTPSFESPETVAGFGVGREAEPRQGTSSDVESAGSILAQFGLSSEDLELLTQYPDEQLTPETLPIILRTISVLKSKPNPLTHDDHTPAAAVPQSTVIDYGHARKPCHTVEGTAFKREPLGKDMPTSSPVRTSKGARPGKSCQPMDIQGASRTTKKPTPDGQSHLDSPSRDKVPKTTPSPSRRSSKPDLDLRSRESKSTYRPAFPLRSPTPTMISDYVAAPPKIFPHTCSLCNQVCLRTQDWLEHQNTNQHIDSCRNLRKKYPDWSPHPGRPSRMEEGRPRPSRSPPRSPRERSPRERSQRRNQQSRSRSPRSEPRPPKPQRRTLSPPTHTTRPSSKPRPPKAVPKPSPKPSSESLVKTILKSTGMSLESLARSLGPTLLAHLKKTNPAGPAPSSKTASARRDKTVPSPSPKSSKKLSSSAAKSHSSSSSSSHSSSARSAVSKLRSPWVKMAAASAAPSSAKHNKCPKNGNYTSPNKDVRKKDSIVMSVHEVVSPSCKQPSAPGPTLSVEAQDPRREEQRKNNRKKPTIPGAPQMEKPGAADSKHDAERLKQDAADSKQDTTHPKQDAADSKQDTTHPKQDAADSKQDTTHPKQETAQRNPASVTTDRPHSPRPGAIDAKGSPQVTPELLQALLRECRARAAAKSAPPAPPAAQEKQDCPEMPKDGRRTSPHPREQGGKSTRLVPDGEGSARFDMDQFVTVDEVEAAEDFVTADEFVTVDEVGEAAQEGEEPADLERGWEVSQQGRVMGNEVGRMDGEGAVDGTEEEDGEMKVTCASAGLQKRGLGETSPFGPPLKRPRSQPLFPRDYQMPTYSPDCPIGLDYLVSKTGFLCQLCSMFYSDDEVSRKTHCSSLKHYQNMEKCLQRWREKQGSQS